MIPIIEFTKKLKFLCDFYVEYDDTNKTFLFNNIYIDEVNIAEFENSINHLKYDLIDVLRSVKEPQIYINELLEVINDIKKWYLTEKIDRFENFEKLFKIITTTENNIIRQSKTVYNRDLIQQNSNEMNGVVDTLLYYIILHKSKTNNYKDEFDLERVKLHYVIVSYFRAIDSFNTFLLEISSLISSYGIHFSNWEQIEPLIQVNLKCNFNYSKIRLAQFFKLLYKYKIINFGTDPFKSTVNMKRFIETNFNYYTGDSKIQGTKNINQEFSVLANYHKDEQIKFCEEIIQFMKEEIHNLNTSPIYKTVIKK